MSADVSPDFHIVQTQSRHLDLSDGFGGLLHSRSMQRLHSGDELNVRGRSLFTIPRVIVGEGINMLALLLNLIHPNISVFSFRCSFFFSFFFLLVSQI